MGSLGNCWGVVGVVGVELGGLVLEEVVLVYVRVRLHVIAVELDS